MIFVGGIHGVGKSYFCDLVTKEMGIKSYSASTLIEKHKKEAFAKDKLIPDIEANQPYLLKAIEELNASEGIYLLDGHFCLLNANGEAKSIEIETFKELKPEAILLLTEKPDIIAKRRQNRDNIKNDVTAISSFQMQEIENAIHVAKLMDKPLYIIEGSHKLQGGIDFIKQIIKTMDWGI